MSGEQEFRRHSVQSAASVVTSGLILLVAATPAWANVGTPLMWAAPIHLLFGNAVIGIGEGLLLGKIFGISKGRAVGLMILANYASAWLGFWLLHGFVNEHLQLDLENTWKWLWIVVAAAYGLTLLFEWPFVAFCFRGQPGWFRRSISGSLLVQSASYLLLIGWYGLASDLSLYTQHTIVPREEIQLPAGMSLFYIDDADGDVYRWHFPEGSPEKIYELDSGDINDCLTFDVQPVSAKERNLVALLGSGDSDSDREVPLGVGFAVDRLPIDPDGQVRRAQGGWWFSDGRAARLGSASDRGWEFYASYWPTPGLSGSNSQTGASLRLSCEAPIARWPVRFLVQLPGGLVLFQLGERQICILDPETRRVARLAFGRGPTVVLDEVESVDEAE